MIMWKLREEWCFVQLCGAGREGREEDGREGGSSSRLRVWRLHVLEGAVTPKDTFSPSDKE